MCAEVECLAKKFCDTLLLVGVKGGGARVSVCELHVKYFIYIMLFYSGPQESRGAESTGQHCAVWGELPCYFSLVINR